MQVNEDVTIYGLNDLNRALRSILPQHFHQRVTQKALSKGAAVIANAAKRNVGKGGTYPASITGTLRRAIHHRKSKFSTNEKPMRIVAIRYGKKEQTRHTRKGKPLPSRDGWYGRLVEYGHRSRAPGEFSELIGRRMSSWSTFVGPTRFVPAHPFMRPAWNENKYEAVRRIKDALIEELDKAIEKARW